MPAMNAPKTIGGRLLLGFLGLFAISAVGVTVAQRAARDVHASVERVAALADEGRRLGEVAALVRDFYIHQAHLALGLHADVHLAETRAARAQLEEALGRYEHTTPARPAAVSELRRRLAELDRLLDERFLPALRVGRRHEALDVHHDAVDSVEDVLERLDDEQGRVAGAISHARAASDARSQRALWESAGALAGALALGLAVAVWMSRAITAPVARLRTAAQALPGAPPHTRVPEDGPAEVAALGVVLNQTLGALEVQRRARAEAETLAAIGRVAAGIAHEVNNPLGVILGHARLIERTGGPGAEDAGVIAREARACQAIVQDLLDYARPGARRAEPVDLVEVARAAAERAGGGSVRAAGPVEVRGDARRLQQLVYNLVVNGLAFGHDVTVDVAALDGGARLTVRDDGPGVPPADRERVFEPFFSTRTGGTGLGLAIARSIAVQHGGTLRAHGGGDRGGDYGGGPGGCFELWLPWEADGGADPGG